MKFRNYLIKLVLPALLTVLASCTTQPFRITSLTCNNQPEPMGVNPVNPAFSWKMESPARGVMQTAYQVVVFENGGKGEVWNSGKVESNKSIFIAYEGSELKPGTIYFWKVKAWDNMGHESAWRTGRFVTGLVQGKDWEGARWIGYGEMDSARRIVPGIHSPGSRKEWKDVISGDHVLPLLRKEFSVKSGLESAFLFVSGLGHYEIDLNGQKVGDHFLAPGWTHYDSLCFYNVFEVTDELQKGENACGVWLGNGFYNIPNTGYRKLITAFGNPKMILKLQLIYKDGSRENVISDESWKTIPGPITNSSIFAGETFNASLEPTGWNQPGFNESGWKQAQLVTPPASRLEAETDYPVKVMERLNVKSITRTDSSETQYLYDFGQNASGIVELEVSGNKGDTVRLVPAELIDRTGKPNQKATGRPYSFTYILKGSGIERWSPRFTYYGFRYVGVSGAVPDTSSVSGNQPRIKRMTLLHTRNSAPETGTFQTSADLFNRINTLIRWAIKSNLQSVATDCPHREKLGWLEQTHLMGNGIHYNFDILPLYKKQVNDMMIAQTAEGLIPDIAPEYVPFAGGFRDSPEWGSAGVILPWMLYKWYGDTEAMKKAWPMMARYVAYLKSKSVNHILDYGLGDWFDLGPKSPGTAQLTPVSLTATAIYYYDVSLMQEMAAILGKEDEAKTYAAWADEIKAAFNAKFLDPESLVYSTGSQTAIAMPLSVGLVDQDKKDSVFRTLLSSVRNSGFALTAGDVGFHFLVKALSEGGAGELLYDMNARDDVPGYGYQLKKGATALTESWPALEQVSNNHLMLGHLMEWFYTGLAGIDQTNTSVAFREIKIAPQMVGKINEAGATFESPYGTISSHWKKDESGVDWEITIPVNTTAELWLSVGEGETVTESIKPLSGEWKKSQEGEKLVIKVGSGKYRFSVKSGK